MTEQAVDPREERVLLLLPAGRGDDPEANLIRLALAEAGVAVEFCADLDALAAEAPRGAGAALVAEEALTPDSLPRIKQILAGQPAWSDLPLLVLDSGPKGLGAYLAGEVPCVTLIDRPVRAPSLVSAVMAALRGRRRQYELRDLLLDAERTRRQRDEFLAMLGHELRNPLGAISAAVQVLNRVGSPSPEAAEMRDMVERQAAHLTRLVDDLLDVSRVHSGRIALQREPVDLNDVARQCLQACEGMIAAQRHHVTFTPSPGPATVDVDPVRMEQVINNLLTNAIKYTPAGGEIWLDVLLDRRRTDAGPHPAAAAPSDEAVVRVRDTGIGIEAEMLEPVFDLFTQGDRPLDRSQGGVGLGLTLVRRLVQMHGGTVRATSGGSGRGSTFEVRLPALPPADAAAPASQRITGSAPPAEPAHPPSHPRHVLIIEDGPDARRALGRLLEIWGHRVEVAEDGTRGVERAIASRPDVALIDIGLPGLNGYEVARRLRQVLGDKIRLIALTGYGQPDDHERTRAAGFDRHLVKPVNPRLLSRMLQDEEQPAAR
jgi:signal transduction histidine kinase/ActR/RegA family two-component response regulator